MKRFVISAATAASLVGFAHADVTVMTPKPPVTQDEADAYVAKLDAAVRRVCLQEFSPVIGVNYYLYGKCLKSTAADVAKKDPTGLFAARQPAESTVLAAR